MQGAIIGIGQTEFSTNSGRGELQLALEAILAAVADAGLEVDAVDGLVRYTWDVVTEAAIVNALGLPRLTYCGETEFGGVNCCAAIGQACAAIGAGLASCVVVYRALNARSGTRYGRGERVLHDTGEAVVTAQPEPPGDVYGAPFGLLAPAHFHALYARSYMARYGLDEVRAAEMLGAVAVVQRAYAHANPNALMRGRPLSREQYLAGRMIASPLRLYDLCLETDGAMALVVVSAHRAEALGARGAAVLATGQYVHPGSTPMLVNARDTHSLVPPQAADDLFGRAGVVAADIDVAMIYDATSILVPIALEDFGFVGRGEAPGFLAAGGHGPGGALPVNTHGGLLSEGYFHGLNSIAEAVRQLRGDACNPVRCETAFVTCRGASSMVLGRT